MEPWEITCLEYITDHMFSNYGLNVALLTVSASVGSVISLALLIAGLLVTSHLT